MEAKSAATAALTSGVAVQVLLLRAYHRFRRACYCRQPGMELSLPAQWRPQMGALETHMGYELCVYMWLLVIFLIDILYIKWKIDRGSFVRGGRRFLCTYSTVVQICCIHVQMCSKQNTRQTTTGTRRDTHHGH